MSRRTVFDSSIVIGHLRRSKASRSWDDVSEHMIVGWAEELIEIHDTNAIVTPVKIELLAGVMSQLEGERTRQYLACFDCVDKGDIRSQDWVDAERIASRVPHNPQPRQLGDCLIRAIANLLRYDVLTRDLGFPR